MSYIFVSHATRDDKVVSQIVDSLEPNTGRKFWVDHKDLKPPKSNWRAAIHDALHSCAAGFLVLSRNSISRPEIVSEWTYLLDTNHDLFVVKIDDVPIEDIDYRLHIVQWVDLTKDWTDGITALAQYIREGTFPQNAPLILARPITGRIDRRLTCIPISGRNEDIRIVKDKLRKGPTTIVGVGGLGKSRLAAEIVMTSESIQGAIWHTAGDVSHPDEVIVLLRDHFGLEATASQRELLAQLRTHKRLVVLDNAEAVPDERRSEYVKLVDDLHDAGGQVLLTSRTEWEEIEMGSSHRPLTLTLEAAKKIVLDMQVAFETPDLSSYTEDLANAARLHPRLIEWAVRQAKRFPLNKVVQDLHDLNSQRVQEALDEMIRKTMRQMVEQEGIETASALKRLGVCRGGFTFEAAEAILELANDTDKLYTLLNALQSWQFVTFDGQRYDIDQLVREAVGEDETAHLIHYNYILNLAREHGQPVGIVNWDDEIFNLEIALIRSYQRGLKRLNVEETTALWDAWEDILHDRGFILTDWGKTVAKMSPIIRSLHQFLVKAKEIIEILDPEEPQLAIDREQLQQAVTALETDQIEAAREYVPEVYAHVLNVLGLAKRRLNEPSSAIAYWREAESFYRQAGNIDGANRMLKSIAETE